MSEEKRKELAEQISEAFTKLQGMEISARATNVDILSAVFGILRYVYNGLTAEEAEHVSD